MVPNWVSDEPEPELAVVVRLAEEERDAEDHGHADGPDEAAPVTPPDRPDAELAGERADDEDDRQDEREPRLGVEVEPLGQLGVTTGTEFGEAIGGQTGEVRGR